jgi:hypothetical protein
MQDLLDDEMCWCGGIFVGDLLTLLSFRQILYEVISIATSSVSRLSAAPLYDQ